jgi:hypothetical protein
LAIWGRFRPLPRLAGLWQAVVTVFTNKNYVQNHRVRGAPPETSDSSNVDGPGRSGSAATSVPETEGRGPTHEAGH